MNSTGTDDEEDEDDRPTDLLPVLWFTGFIVFLFFFVLLGIMAICVVRERICSTTAVPNTFVRALRWS